MIATAGAGSAAAGPAALAGQLYLKFAPKIASILGGHRNTESLVPGVSYPGYDAQGNDISGGADPYQFADFSGGPSMPNNTGAIDRILAGLSSPWPGTGSPQTPGINPNAKTPSGTGTGTTTTAAPADTGFLAQIAKALGQISNTAQSAGTIASLVPKPNESREQAAGLQKNIQDAATQIEAMVNSGQMDPESALLALTSLQQRVNQLGGIQNPDYQRAAQIAGIVVSNVIGNVTNRRTQNVNTPIAGGLLPGGVGQQREQFGTAVRNRLATGTTGAAGPEIDRLLTPGTRPTDRLAGVSQKVNQIVPDLVSPDFGAQIRDRMQKFLSQPQEY